MRKREPQLPFVPAPLPIAPLDERARLACLRLIRSENVGPVTFRQLINHCGGAEAALSALPDLARRGGSNRPIKICSVAAAKSELEAAGRLGAQPLFTIEPGYPNLLAGIDMPPPLLYVKGDTGLLAKPMLAIVGSRDASAAGQKLARMFADDLGRAGFVVVSGLARGIDRAAHEAAMATGTVAVLAGGVDMIYPPEHAALQEALGKRGCLVTTMPPGFQPRAKDFPRRNRIISGLSWGVVVIEAAQRSGTLVTARMAGEQGREVFAVPGHPLDPRAVGTNGLLKSGATLVTEAADIIEALSPQTGIGVPSFREAAVVTPDFAPLPAPIPAPPDEEARQGLLAALGPAPIDIDELARSTGLPIRSVQALLMELDLAGRIERHSGQLVSLKPSAGP